MHVLHRVVRGMEQNNKGKINLKETRHYNIKSLRDCIFLTSTYNSEA